MTLTELEQLDELLAKFIDHADNEDAFAINRARNNSHDSLAARLLRQHQENNERITLTKRMVGSFLMRESK